MRECLDKHFPGWSWEAAAPLHFLGAEWVVAQGHLIIVDEHLIAFGIQPPIRKFYGVDSVRIQYGQGKPHTPENIVILILGCIIFGVILYFNIHLIPVIFWLILFFYEKSFSLFLGPE